MFDHILMFPDEAAAHTALSPLGYSHTDQDGNTGWDTSRVCPGVSIVLADEVWDHTDPGNPVITTPKQTIPGYFMIVSEPQHHVGLIGLPDNACRIIGSAAASAAGQPFVTYLAPDMNPATLAAVLRVEPTIAGRDYNFSTAGA